jgi:hypothetical protein
MFRAIELAILDVLALSTNGGLAQAPADLVVLEGKVVTVDKDFSMMSAVGSKEEVKQFVSPDTRAP